MWLEWSKGDNVHLVSALNHRNLAMFIFGSIMSHNDMLEQEGKEIISCEKLLLAYCSNQCTTITLYDLIGVSEICFFQWEVI